MTIGDEVEIRYLDKLRRGIILSIDGDFVEIEIAGLTIIRLRRDVQRVASELSPNGPQNLPRLQGCSPVANVCHEAQPVLGVQG